MKRIIPFYILFLILVLSVNSTAQPNLVLSKTGSRKHFFYRTGDKITYKDRISGRKISGTIMIMTDSTIELARAPRINLKDISTVYRTRHFFSQAAGAGIVVLGIYIPISILNNALQHRQPWVNEDILYVNGPMLAVSGISFIFLTRKFQINDPWKLQILDFGHPVYN